MVGTLKTSLLSLPLGRLVVSVVTMGKHYLGMFGQYHQYCSCYLPAEW